MQRLPLHALTVGCLLASHPHTSCEHGLARSVQIPSSNRVMAKHPPLPPFPKLPPSYRPFPALHRPIANNFHPPRLSSLCFPEFAIQILAPPRAVGHTPGEMTRAPRLRSHNPRSDRDQQKYEHRVKGPSSAIRSVRIRSQPEGHRIRSPCTEMSRADVAQECTKVRSRREPFK